MEIKGIVVPGGFALKSSQPLDARTVVSSLADLDALITKGVAYQGIVVYVNSNTDDKGLYVCESISDNGTWKRVGSATADVIKIGETTITETQLKKIIKFINTIEDQGDI